MEISGDTEVKEEEGGSSNGEEQDYENGDWFVSALKVKSDLSSAFQVLYVLSNSNFRCRIF